MSSANYIVVPSYIPIRDDSGLISLSTNEKDFIIHQCCSSTNSSSTSQRTLRMDGRTVNQIRPIQLQLHRGDNVSTCTVQWGKGTRVSCTVYADLVPPLDNRPSEGSVVITVDISPASSTTFRQALPSSTGGGGGGGSGGGTNLPTADRYQKLQSNRIVRCLERMIIQGGVLDQEALCVSVGQWVWKLYITVTVMDFGGNIIDASIMACMASLRHYRKPIVTQQSQQQSDVAEDTPMIPQSTNIPTSSSSLSKSGSIVPVGVVVNIVSPNVKEPTPLPLHHTPLSISFALIPGTDNSTKYSTTTHQSSSHVIAFMDPNSREELCCSNAFVTVGLNVYGEICLFEFSSGSSGIQLNPTQIRELYNSAKHATIDMFASFEQSLQQADEQAFHDRLQSLQQKLQQQPKHHHPPPHHHQLLHEPPVVPNNGIPYFQTADPNTDEFMMINNNENDNDDTNKNIIREAQNDAEEVYRRQALDYNVGHIATKIRENDEKKDSTPNSNKISSTTTKSRFAAATTATTTTAATNPSAASSLLRAMLKSVSAVASSSSMNKNNDENDDDDDFHGSATRSMAKQQDATIHEDDNDDEEEVGTMLNNAQASSVKKKSGSKAASRTEMDVDQNDDDEEEDVQMNYKSEFDPTISFKTTEESSVPVQALPSLPATMMELSGELESNNKMADLVVPSNLKIDSSFTNADEDDVVVTSTGTIPSIVKGTIQVTKNSDVDRSNHEEDIDDLAAAIKKKSSLLKYSKMIKKIVYCCTRLTGCVAIAYSEQK